MLIAGIESPVIDRVTPSSMVCPCCKDRGSTEITVRRHHFQLFKIPFLPLYRSGTAECLSCRFSSVNNPVSRQFKRVVRKVVKEASGPVWQFSGWALIAVVFSLFIWGESNQNQKLNELFLQPQVNDIYHFKTEDGLYASFKIVDMSETQWVISENISESHSLSDLKAIDPEVGFSNYSFAIAKDVVEEELTRGVIVDISRPMDQP